MTTKSVPKAKKKTDRPLRAPGRKRREILLNAAVELLSARKLEDVSYRDIYEAAKIPASSAYHFFTNKEDLIEALVNRYYEQHELDLRRHIEPKRVHSWRDVVDILNWRAAQYHNEHQAEAQAHFSPYLHQAVIISQESSNWTSDS